MTIRGPVRLLILTLVALALLLGVSAWILGSKLVEPANHSVAMPAGFYAPSVSIPGGGHSIAGWWVDQGGDSPVVLLLHAVRADRSTMVSRAQLLMKHGFSVLLIDLQAHGETPGEAITLGFRESADVVAARDWIKRIAPGRKIGVVGCSLGGASVLIAAGSKDEHTTLGESREMFEAAAVPKSLWIVEGAKHQDLLAYDGAGYEEHVVGFLAQALGR
jgi:alpha-beta hydrolase superfamily lysophospholipase